MNVFLFKGKPSYDSIVVSPGQWVVIKPNLVKEHNLAKRDEWKAVITSPEIISSVVDHVARGLKGIGRITICDAPQTDSSFAAIDQTLGLSNIAEAASIKYGIRVEVLDLRNEEWKCVDETIVERKKLAGDPSGAIAYNLGKQSMFNGHAGEGRYYGADYDAGVVNKHHNGSTQEYLICGTPVRADVFINIAKLKTHKKTGVTLCLKNLVGINADKNWLPHHTDGSPKNGGDQFPDLTFKRRLEQVAVNLSRQLALRVPWVGTIVARKLRGAGKAAFGDQGTIRSGNWHGNDTTWRMVLDLNRCLLYGNADGTLREHSPKRYYCVVDGLIGMEGVGPMHGDPVASGVVLVGDDPVAVDMVCARVMGFDWRKVPVISNGFAPHPLPITSARPEDVVVISDFRDWDGRFLDVEKREFFHFKPHFGWAGKIEYVPSR